MNRPFSESKAASWTRRRFLAGAGSIFLVGGIGRADATQEEEEVTPPVIVPVVEEFEDNYVGQFLTLRSESTDAGDLEAVKGACQELPWPEDEAQQIEGQITDRRSDEAVAVRLPVFIDGRQRPEQDDALYIINQATPCGDEYVTVQLSAVNLRNITGGEAGPTAGENGGSTTDGVGTGLGLLAGGVGGVGAVLARYLTDRDTTD